MNTQGEEKQPTFEDIMEAIYPQASELLNACQTPRVLEVGTTQDAVLKAGGVTTDTLVIGAGRETDRVDREDWLRVSTGE